MKGGHFTRGNDNFTGGFAFPEGIESFCRDLRDSNPVFGEASSRNIG